MCAITTQLLLKLGRPAPRYTSYPTAPEWSALSHERALERLSCLNPDEPLSLYFHIPFCKTMCLYCGCSVVLNRKEENEERYVDYLIKEINLLTLALGKKRRVVQLHFGGGTPTKLSIPLFSRLFEKIDQSFVLDYTQEIAIEVDPRTVVEDEGAKLKVLKQLGFNRISFGVQDTDPKVQEAIKRRQSLEMTEKTFALARSLAFKGINIDLIYGLPFQTTQTFERTVQHMLKLRPDRIAFFSYAKVPWLKSHQRAIKECTLPSTEEKFEIYVNARQSFIDHGYVAIGMDHFALAEDELAKGYFKKSLQRNFQGYSLKLSETTLGLGITSIGYIQGAYFQNLKELNLYYDALDRKILPVHKGKLLSEEDLLRKWVIHTLMCDFQLEKAAFQKLFKTPFDTHFSANTTQLDELEKSGLLINTPERVLVTPLGELFVRNIAMIFDAYLTNTVEQPKFSYSI